MEIKGKIHCFFEQSGTFKKEFRKLGYEAFDYDIQNDFGQTDYIIDLFKEIDNAYEGKPSVFDNIDKDDLIIAFFPCTFFCALSQLGMLFNCVNYRKMSIREKTDRILARNNNREHHWRLVVKLYSICWERGLRLIIENPWSEQTFLKNGFVSPPTLVDNDRSMRGDYYKKPTAYWFVNCEPTNGRTIQKRKPIKVLEQKGGGGGICSKERSMISPDYARNFICDFLIGKTQDTTELKLFDD